jgi:SAM-dependent methyltransferase
MPYKQIPYDFNPDIRYPAYLTRKGLLRALTVYIPQLKGRLMDFGCGSKPYKSLFTVDEYIGVDYDSEGHPHDDEPVDIFYDGKHLPFPDQHFDSVFSTEVFEHVFNLEEILLEINRVMKPGARILITCPFVICEHEEPNDYARYTIFALRSLFENSGFKVLEIDKTGGNIEAIMQLKITYIARHILPVFRKIPVVRSLARLVVYSSMNLYALLLSAILPRRKDLYLNNIFLCEKL